MTDNLLLAEPGNPPLATLLLAHGAGAPMDSPFMEQLSAALCERGIRVVRFEFPYMAARREDGRKRPPNPLPALQQCLREQAASMSGPWLVGGKSMGGRVASLLVDELGALGLVCYGYPFHPPGKPEKTRTAHLEALATPALVVQGTRDPFGRPEEVSGYRLADSLQVHWLDSGDHDFKPLKASGRTQALLIEEAAEATLAFVQGVISKS